MIKLELVLAAALAITTALVDDALRVSVNTPSVVSSSSPSSSVRPVKTRDDEVSLVMGRLMGLLPGVLVPAMVSTVANATELASLETLPVFGKTIACLVRQAGSPEVTRLLNRSSVAVAEVAKKALFRVATNSTDSCR